MPGWIKLHRDIENHWIFSDAERFKAWITIILKVNYEDKKTYVSGELIDCKRGQSLYSLSTWAGIFGKGWTVQKVRTFFDLLKKDAMINTEGLRKTTRLTVLNYGSYQNIQQADNIQTNLEQTQRKHGDNKEITSTKEGKEGKESKEYLESEFEKFWKLYDKKQDRKKCEQKWNRLKKEDKEKIFQTLPEYIKATPEKQYRKNPLTYLNGEVWNDEEIAIKNNAKQSDTEIIKAGLKDKSKYNPRG